MTPSIFCDTGGSQFCLEMPRKCFPRASHLQIPLMKEIWDKVQCMLQRSRREDWCSQQCWSSSTAQFGYPENRSQFGWLAQGHWSNCSSRTAAWLVRASCASLAVCVWWRSWLCFKVKILKMQCLLRAILSTELQQNVQYGSKRNAQQ